MAGLVLQDAPRPVRVPTFKGQRNEPVLGTHLHPPRRSEFTRCFRRASSSSCPDRRVVVHGKQREVPASKKTRRSLQRSEEEQRKFPKIDCIARDEKSITQKQNEQRLQESMTTCPLEIQQKKCFRYKIPARTRIQKYIVANMPPEV